jgi:hypothetical protein
MGNTRSIDSMTPLFTMAASCKPVLEICGSKDEMAEALGKTVYEAATEAVSSRGRFSMAVSGGSLPNVLRKGLEGLSAAKVVEMRTETWRIVFADERCVPLEHDDSNYRLCVPVFSNVRPVSVLFLTPSSTPHSSFSSSASGEGTRVSSHRPEL